MPKKRIYLDYSASTPIDPKVLSAMLPYLKREYGNPSSVHSFGQKAMAAIENARKIVADFLDCLPEEVVFTGGATEANNTAIWGVIKNFQASIPNDQKKFKPHVVVSAIEHESVIELVKRLEKQGIIEATYVGVNKEGMVDPKDVAKTIKENTALVSIMYANSVIGTIQPIKEIGEAIREKSSLTGVSRRFPVIFHTDAVQSAQYLPCGVKDLGVDLLTISAHKLYGPKGVGALYIKKGTVINPLVIGGGQENGARAGTQNVAGIVGFGEAIRTISNPRSALTNIKIRQLRDKLIKAVLKKIPGVRLNGSAEKRLPSNVHFCFDGVEGRDVVMLLDQKGAAISTGSACSERSQEPDHVLLALGLSAKEALGGVRITLGKYTKTEEVENTIKYLSQAITQLRKTA